MLTASMFKKFSNVLHIFFENIFQKFFSVYAFSLLLVINILSIVIFTNIILTASIAKHEYNRQFSMDEYFLGAIYIFLIQLCLMILSFIISDHSITIFNLMVIALILPSEIINYKFLSCFNYSKTEMVIRSMLLIAVMVFSILATFKRDNNLVVFKFSFLSFLSFAVSLVLIVINIKLLYMFTASNSSYSIMQSEINLGFFSQFEIDAIRNGSLIEDQTFNDRIIGNLEEIAPIRSSPLNDYINGLLFYTNEKKITFDIECSNKTKVLFKDCLDTDVKSLRVILKYLKNKSPILTYPNYNCYVNTNLKQHQYICTHLLVMEHMQLIFIQSNDKKIEFAWDGFGKCLKQPNVKLNFDLKIY